MADDHELWERIRGGDASAFEAFYRDNATRLCAFLRQIVGSPQAAEDLMQEAFTQMWKSPNGFRPERGSLRGYLFGIGRKRAAEWWRKRGRVPEAQHERSREEAVEAAASFSAIGDALSRLAEEQRSLLWLREVEGQSYAELGDSANSGGQEVEIVCCTRRAAPHLARLERRSKEYEMNSVEARECVSALFDGEPISREAAAHLSDCDECRVRFTEYAEISADLRRMASAASAQAIPEGQWRSAELAAGTNWVRNWKGTMRIPRFAFALMLVAIFALTGGLALVKARPEGLGSIEVSGEFLKPESVAPTWFQYKMLGRDGEMIVGGIVPTNPRGNPSYDRESGMPYTDGAVYFHFRMLEQIGEAEKIGVRTLWIPRGAHNQTSGPVVVVDGNEDPFEKLRNMPEREFFYVPGKDLEIPVEGYGNLAMRGHFESTLPDTVGMGRYPVDGHFRIDSPVVLVREKEMLAKFDGGRGEVSLAKSYFAYGTQQTGWYLFSAKPIASAIEGTLKMNQIEFTLDGKHYLLLTGDPIVLGSVKIWVKHYDSIRDADPTSSGDGWQQNEPRLAFGQLANLAFEK